MVCSFFLLLLLLLLLFSSPNLSRHRLDVYHTSAHGVVLVMVALCNRETIYIFMLWFVLPSSFFMVALWNRETIYIFILFYGRPME